MDVAILCSDKPVSSWIRANIRWLNSKHVPVAILSLSSCIEILIHVVTCESVGWDVQSDWTVQLLIVGAG